MSNVEVIVLVALVSVISYVAGCFCGTYEGLLRGMSVMLSVMHLCYGDEEEMEDEDGSAPN